MQKPYSQICSTSKAWKGLSYHTIILTLISPIRATNKISFTTSIILPASVLFAFLMLIHLLPRSDYLPFSALGFDSGKDRKVVEQITSFSNYCEKFEISMGLPFHTMANLDLIRREMAHSRELGFYFIPLPCLEWIEEFLPIFQLDFHSDFENASFRSWRL